MGACINQGTLHGLAGGHIVGNGDMLGIGQASLAADVALGG